MIEHYIVMNLNRHLIRQREISLTPHGEHIVLIPFNDYFINQFFLHPTESPLPRVVNNASFCALSADTDRMMCLHHWDKTDRKSVGEAAYQQLLTSNN